MRHLLKLKCEHSPLNLSILSSKSVPFTLPTLQAPNLLPQTKRITVYMLFSINLLLGDKTLILYDLSRTICWFKQDRFLIAYTPPSPQQKAFLHIWQEDAEQFSICTSTSNGDCTSVGLATMALIVRCSNHSARTRIYTRLDLIHPQLDHIRTLLGLIPVNYYFISISQFCNNYKLRSLFIISLHGQFVDLVSFVNFN